MSDTPKYDWDARAEQVLEDQIAAYDEMRKSCAVAHSEYLYWSLFRHEDVMRVLLDHETFSNAVSRHLSVPNGMDPPQHTAYRKIIEPYFSAERMRQFEPVCRRIAAELAAALPAPGEVELMTDFAHPFALRIQCAFLGWPESLHEPLRQWIRKNHQATLAGDRAAMASVAMEFDGYIRALLAERRSADASADDVTSSLMREQVDGRPLNEAELVSLLRNWTVGELSTIASSIGIIVHYLARHPQLQQRLRREPELLPAAIDEILRMQAPLISNRRVTTRPVEIGGRSIGAGERITIMWASANRDEAVFGDPDEFRLDRDPRLNLLYGAGIHVCPGAPLARLELKVLMEELLKAVPAIEPVPGQEPPKAIYPASGYTSVPLRLLNE